MRLNLLGHTKAEDVDFQVGATPKNDKPGLTRQSQKRSIVESNFRNHPYSKSFALWCGLLRTVNLRVGANQG